MKPRHRDPAFYVFMLGAGLVTWIAPALFVIIVSTGIVGALLWGTLASVEYHFRRWRNG